jgi:hypothetical protein
MSFFDRDERSAARIANFSTRDQFGLDSCSVVR